MRFLHHDDVWAVRAFGWQADYRLPGAWFPFSIRYGHRKWHVVNLGKLGYLTAGRVIRIES